MFDISMVAVLGRSGGRRCRQGEAPGPRPEGVMGFFGFDGSIKKGMIFPGNNAQ
jgi:hypothetical protein